MAIGDIFTAAVESVAPGGDGVLRYGGRTVFMALAAPGDRVTGRIREERRDWALAELLEITGPSPLRVKPECPLYGECGGCSLQHINYQAQLDAKETALTDCLAHIGGLTPPRCTVVPSPPWEYRNRVSLHAVRANKGPRCGFKARESGEIIPVEDCPVLDPGIRGVLKTLKPPPGKDRFTLYARGPLLLAEEGTELSAGNAASRGSAVLLDRKITLDASCFFQANGTALEALVGQLLLTAKETASAFPGGKMADLYAGVGTFSLFLSEFFPDGTDLMEENARALNLAKTNLTARSSGPDRPAGPFRFFPQKDETWAGKQSLRPYTFVLADPPRKGLSPALARKLAEETPPVFAYVSCDPASLARDSRVLTGAYHLDELYFFDFYPQTAHIESLAVFRKKRGSS
ncbi:MAG: methyltransferase [Treponema sp.]|jgi:23S rRNA (uracil1939-C5)-methyltransferase|nr:methyltransferase [Treponema sp.]